MTVEFGYELPFPGPEKGKPVSTWMDELDTVLPTLVGKFKSLWVTDHFIWKEDPTYEAMTTLSYIAARWPQFDVGPMVMSQGYRNPAVLAKMASTLQCLSGGRFIFGLGAGWKEDEYHAYNIPFPPVGVRMEQLIDTLEIVKRMWTEPYPVTFQGKHYSVTDAYCEPRPDPAPKILIGGGGNRTMKITAKYADWWNLSDADAARFADRASVLKGHCEAIGRDPSSVRLTWFGRMAVAQTEAEAIKIGRRLRPGETEEDGRVRGREIYTRQNGLVGTPSQIVEQMQALVAVGCDYFMIDFLEFANPDVRGMVLEEILPKVR